MKKFILFSIICLFAIAGFSRNLTGDYYMDSTNEKLYCKKISLGKEVTVVILENGQEVTVPTSEIKMYSVDGKIYEKLPVYINNQNTNTSEFMEFMATRAGLKLYKYTMLEKKSDKKPNAKRKVEKYYVFKGDQFWMEVTEKTKANQSDFFGVTL